MKSTFPAIYEAETPPLPGYEGIAVQLRVNPTGAIWDDWVNRRFPSELVDLPADAPERGAVEAGVAALGRALHALYGPTQCPGLDFSTPEAALATWASPELPDELLTWLALLPGVRLVERREEIQKKLPRPSSTAS